MGVGHGHPHHINDIQVPKSCSVLTTPNPSQPCTKKSQPVTSSFKSSLQSKREEAAVMSAASSLSRYRSLLDCHNWDIIKAAKRTKTDRNHCNSRDDQTCLKQKYLAILFVVTSISTSCILFPYTHHTVSLITMFLTYCMCTFTS